MTIEEATRAMLTGIRVIDLGAFITAPLAGMMLADLGADVIKVEPPDGDPFRRGHGGTYGATFVAYNRNKRSLVARSRRREGAAQPWPGSSRARTCWSIISARACWSGWGSIPRCARRAVIRASSIARSPASAPPGLIATGPPSMPWARR